MEQSVDYEVTKREILKAYIYELVPEAYRQQFHEIECKEGQTYGICPSKGSTLSQQFDDSFERHKQLTLLEEFQEVCSCYNQNIPRRAKSSNLSR